jgi:hypothetical protein
VRRQEDFANAKSVVRSLAPLYRQQPRQCQPHQRQAGGRRQGGTSAKTKSSITTTSSWLAITPLAEMVLMPHVMRTRLMPPPGTCAPKNDSPWLSEVSTLHLD